tara:strand:+ start:831 stop:1235 length:405 start_codon:yes stop_codon:yes gene_type:complete
MSTQTFTNTQIVAQNNSGNTGNYNVSVPNWDSDEYSFTSASVQVHKVVMWDGGYKDGVYYPSGTLFYEDIDPSTFTITQGFNSNNGSLAATYNFTTNYLVGYRIMFTITYDDGNDTGIEGDPIVKTFDGKSYRL